MKVHINSLNNILNRFITEEALPKYVSLWRNNGETELAINSKLFMYTAGVKLMLKGNLLTKLPLLGTLVDADGNLNIEDVKSVLLETINDFKNQGKKIVIPNIGWELDEEDIHKIYEISKNYVQG